MTLSQKPCLGPHNRAAGLVQDFETAKTQQDRSLDNIGIGLETLRGVGGAMAQEMVQQDAVLDAIEEKVRLPIECTGVVCSSVYFPS